MRKENKRSCGDCQLCCTLMPVNERFTIKGVDIPTLVKPALERCKHQRFKKGCNIYNKRPLSCRTFECGWLSGNVPDYMRRPDRVGYVIDPNPDTITYTPDDGDPVEIPVVQIWIDPKGVNARGALHLSEEFGWYLDYLAAQGIGVLLREGSREGFVFFNYKGEWKGGPGNLKPGEDQLKDTFTAYIR